VADPNIRHEFEDNPLTEERKEQIYRAMKAWDDSAKEYEDEQDGDYDPPPDDLFRPSGSSYDEDGNLIK